MSVDIIKKAKTMNRSLEYAIPLFAFGGALIGIFFWMYNVPVDIRVPIFGCVIASCILAYLAWIRPRKDIVALTTPIYSFIFLGFPIDNFSAVVLEVLYAVSLSILLVRLKYRFGVASAPVLDKKELADPLLKSYVEKTRDVLVLTGAEPAHSAAVVFVRFAEGEFLAAARGAESAIAHLSDASAPRSLQHAFAIVKEQSERLDKSLVQPESFLVFPPEDAGMLAKVPDPKFGKPEEYDTALDNALLVLYAGAWNASETDHPHLLECQPFAQRLLAP
ncbi:MAG: hypothetical protein NTZ39_08550 [Methanoregula sp.]|nr:hypothetical protein [Methanoregula sp.]